MRWSFSRFVCNKFKKPKNDVAQVTEEENEQGETSGKTDGSSRCGKREQRNCKAKMAV
jgi:hypothetical protein